MIIEFTIDEMKDQIQNDLNIIDWVDRKEYFDFFCKIHPKNNTYKDLFENTSKLYDNNISMRCVLEYWLKRLEELNNNG